MNPAIEAYNEVRDNCEADVQCLLSLGIDISSSATNEQTTSDSVETRDEVLITEARRHRFHVRRFADNKLHQATASLSISDAIKQTERGANAYCGDPKTKGHMESWADRLVRYRRLRAETVRWNEYAGFDVSYPDRESIAGLSNWARKMSAPSVL